MSRAAANLSRDAHYCREENVHSARRLGITVTTLCGMVVEPLPRDAASAASLCPVCDSRRMPSGVPHTARV